MKIAIASGKGGTGKTTVATNLALSIPGAILVDCDVEEPDCHLFLGLEVKHLADVSLKVPVIDAGKCTLCGKCAQFCQYHALAALPSKVMLFQNICHGCGGCSLVCPAGAITEMERAIGVVESAQNGDIHFFRGLLNVGEPFATPVIKALKKMAGDGETVIFDSPPGTACPMIETVRESDYCILVTEPTPFGLHDLKIAVGVVRQLGVPMGVVINRDGSGDGKAEEYCAEEGIPVILKIPHDRKIAELYSVGKPFSLHLPEWKARFRELHKRIRREAGA